MQDYFRIEAQRHSNIMATLAEVLTKLDEKITAFTAAATAHNAEIKKALGNKGPGVFQLPGLVKIERKKVPARAAQKGVPNPFKPGEFMDRPAKPASTKIKVRPLKNLKQMV